MQVNEHEEMRAELSRLRALVGVITPCANCDGSGSNAHGSCCRIPGHAKECACLICQWKTRAEATGGDIEAAA